MRLAGTRGLGAHSYLRLRAKSMFRSRDQGVVRRIEKQCSPSSCWGSDCSTGGLLVTTDIERVSHPLCSHNSDVAEQAQSMIYQPE